MKPGQWYKGYSHFHTGFNYPENPESVRCLSKGEYITPSKRVTPNELAEDFKKAGISFAFCAGDHGYFEGDYYWGIDKAEFKNYENACLSVDKNSGVVFIPAPELHLMFPPYTERHEHHTNVPIVDYTPDYLELPFDKCFAASHTNKVDKFIDHVHSHGHSLTLNHPYAGIQCPLFSGPDPLSIPALHKMDYIELKNSHDLDIYLKFLAHPTSSRMACCSGVDNCENSCLLPSTSQENLPAAYFHVNGSLTKDSLLEAWNDRRSYAVSGNLYLEQVEPVPSRESIQEVGNPVINLTVKNTANKKITSLEIYRNGEKVYEDSASSSDTYCLTWKDEKPLSGSNNYIVHIISNDDRDQSEHLVTSPICYVFN
jgi:hypothetical protein